MTKRSDEITTGSQGFNYHIYRNATDIVVNWQKNIIQQYPCLDIHLQNDHILYI